MGDYQYSSENEFVLSDRRMELNAFEENSMILIVDCVHITNNIWCLRHQAYHAITTCLLK